MPRRCHCDRTVIGGPYARGRDCAKCWLWHNHPPSRDHWEGKAVRFARASNPAPCAHRGAELTGPERQARGLGHARRWTLCLHPAKPLGEAVCSCKGCGPKCSGYSPDN